MPETATVEDIAEAYYTMWQKGCKGGTIYRDNCRPEQVLREKKPSVYENPWKDKYKVISTPPIGSMVTKETSNPLIDLVKVCIEPDVCKLPDDVPQLPRHKFYAGSVKCYLHVGTNAEGTAPVEFFIKVSKAGSTLQCMMDTWAMAASIMLQRGVPLDELVRLHIGTRFEPAGPTRNPEIPMCTSVPDYVVRYLMHKFQKQDITPVAGSGQFCPECASECFYAAGCLTCPKCNWSRCG